MTSCVAKGKRYVNEAIEIWKSDGYVCWKPGNKAHFIGPGRVVSQSQDIFECFDFVATSENGIHWVQVKADPSDASKARALIDALPMPNWTIRIVLMRIKGRPGHFIEWIKIGNGDPWIREEC